MRMYWKNLPMEYYDFKTKTWNVLTAVQNWRSCAALVAHHSNVYLVGGEEVDKYSPTGSRTVNRVTRYDCELQRWSSAPSMLLARRWAASVVMENTLYVVGKQFFFMLKLENLPASGGRSDFKLSCFCSTSIPGRQPDLYP